MKKLYSHSLVKKNHSEAEKIETRIIGSNTLTTCIRKHNKIYDYASKNNKLKDTSEGCGDL